MVSANFFDKYFDMIILPDCHPQFYHGWLSSLRSLSLQHPSLYYSILACSASQVYVLKQVQPFRQLTLEYYDRSIKGVSQLLSTSGEAVATNNALLMSIILLYIHGCLGHATLADIPRHLNAAINLLRLRFSSTGGRIQTPFERIALESVLYQIFIVCMGSWTLDYGHDFSFDAGFWMQAEEMLEQADVELLPESSSDVTNSPILAVPVKLLRLLLTVRELFRRPELQSKSRITLLQDEVRQWEAMLVAEEEEQYDGSPPSTNSTTSTHHHAIYTHALHLYILIASLLVSQLASAQSSSTTISAPIPASQTWQLQHALRIIQSYSGSKAWAKSYICNWCVYTIGFFAGTATQVDVVRRDLEAHYAVTGASQIERFLGELEGVWAARAWNFAANGLDESSVGEQE